MSNPLLDPYGNLGWWHPRPLAGIIADLLIKHADILEATVSKYQLKASPMQTPVESAMRMALMGQLTGEKATARTYNIRGGMKVPHLHYQGEIYLLNDEQWKDFSGQVMKQVQAKLTQAKTVSFPQLMEIAEAVSVLP